MNANVDIDMNYSFLQDDEPTDDQLLVIMREVGEDARRQHEQIAKQLIGDLEQEYARCLADQSAQQR